MRIHPQLYANKIKKRNKFNNYNSSNDYNGQNSNGAAHICYFQNKVYANNVCMYITFFKNALDQNTR